MSETPKGGKEQWSLSDIDMKFRNDGLTVLQMQAYQEQLEEFAKLLVAKGYDMPHESQERLEHASSLLVGSSAVSGDDVTYPRFCLDQTFLLTRIASHDKISWGEGHIGISCTEDKKACTAFIEHIFVACRSLMASAWERYFPGDPEKHYVSE